MCTETVDGQQVFRFRLENVPADVVLEGVWINGNLMSETPQGGFHVQARGSGAYEVELPFKDPAVRWKVSLLPHWDVGVDLI